ncbi:MAG: hypothetical protein HY755_10695 [Nitrospirae bacterium]|nr:hypothetical protein [Nitrospirota bacterium]
MKKGKFLVLFLLIAAGIFWLVKNAHATHDNVFLQAADGAYIRRYSNVPYSPKMTCSTNGCHDPYAVIMWGLATPNVYESEVGYATKDQGGVAYTVPYALHGVSAGYHFQQGRNISWGDAQKNYYNDPSFTSSGGMYGRY